MRLDFRTLVTRLAFTDFAVFDSFHWAATDTGHAVGAGFSPNRSSVFHLDIVHWAENFTKSTAGAVFLCTELLRLYIKSVEENVDRTAFDFVLQGNSFLWQIAALQDIVASLFDSTGSSSDNALGCF